MSETQTKTEQRTAEKEREQKTQKQKAKARQESIIERDGALRQIAAIYLPKIQELKDEMRKAQKEIWDNWREQRSKA